MRLLIFIGLCLSISAQNVWANDTLHELMQIRQITLEHQVGEEITTSTLEFESLMTLADDSDQQFRAEFEKLAEKHGRPLQITTKAQAVSETVELPVSILETTIDAEGKIKSQYSIPAWEMTMQRGDQNITVGWESSKGSIDFNDRDDPVKHSLTLKNMKTSGDEAPIMEIPHITCDVMFTSLFINHSVCEMSEFHLHDGDDKGFGFVGKGWEFDIGSRQDDNGLTLQKNAIQAESMQFSFKDDAFQLNGFEFSNDAQTTDKFITYMWHSQIKALDMSALFDEETKIIYADAWELRNIDRATMLQIQQRIQKLNEQYYAGWLSDEMLGTSALGLFMSTMPVLLKQSPELALKTIDLTKNDEKLTGTASLQVDGSKPLSFQSSAVLLDALKIKVDLLADQGLFEDMVWVLLNIEQSLDVIEEIPEEQMADAVKQRIADLQQQQLITTPATSQYRILATLEAGKLLMNGQELPIPEMW